MMDWMLIVEIAGVIGGITSFLALLLAPMFYLGSKIENFRKEMQAEMKEFHTEMKDFHGRLVSLEERYQIQRGKR